MFNRLVTVRLWRLLATPPRHHVVFKQTLNRKQPSQYAPQRIAGSPLLLSGLALFGSCLCPIFLSVQIRSSPALLFLFVAITLDINNLLYGLSYGLRISGDIAFFMSQGSWSALSTIPNGLSGVIWLNVTGSLYREDRLNRSELLQMFFVISVVPLSYILMILLPLDTPTWTNSNSYTDKLWLLQIVIVPVIIGFATYFNFAQATLIAVLAAVKVVLSVPDRLSSPLWFVMAFSAMQLITLSVIAILAFVVMPAFPSFSYSIGILVFIFTLLFTREIIVRVLLTLLKRNHDIDLLAAARG